MFPGQPPNGYHYTGNGQTNGYPPTNGQGWAASPQYAISAPQYRLSDQQRAVVLQKRQELDQILLLDRHAQEAEMIYRQTLPSSTASRQIPYAHVGYPIQTVHMVPPQGYPVVLSEHVNPQSQHPTGNIEEVSSPRQEAVPMPGPGLPAAPVHRNTGTISQSQYQTNTHQTWSNAVAGSSTQSSNQYSQVQPASSSSYNSGRSQTNSSIAYTPSQHQNQAIPRYTRILPRPTQASQHVGTSNSALLPSNVQPTAPHMPLVSIHPSNRITRSNAPSSLATGLAEHVPATIVTGDISGLFIQIPDNIVVESSLAGALVPAEETSFNQNAQVSTPVSSTSDRAINDNNQLTSAGVSTSTPHTSQPSDHVTSVTPKSAPPAPAIQQSHEPNTIPQTSTTAATNPPSSETVKPSVASHSHPEVDLPSASAHSLPPPSETSSRETEDQANHVTAAQPQEKQSSLNPKPPPPIPPDTNTSSANPTMSDSAVDGPPSNTAGKPSQLNDWAAIEATLQANFDAEVEKLRKQVREACIRHVGDEAALHQVSNITQAQYNWIKSRHDLAKRQLFTAMSQKADKSIKPIPAVPSHSSSPYATVHKTGHNNTTSQSTPISQAAPTAGSSSHPATSQSQPSSSKSTSHSALKSIPSTSIISLSPRGAPTHVSNSQHVDTSIQTAAVGNQQQPKYPSRGLAEDILLALAPFSRKRKRGTEVTESEKSKGKRKTGGSEFASAEANQIVASLALNDAPRSLPVAGKLDKGKGKAVDLEMAMEASNVREMAKALLSDPQPSSILVERGPAVDQTTKGLVEVLDQPSESMEVDPVMNPSATIASNNVPQGEIDSEKTKTPDIVEVSPIRNSSKPPSTGLVTEVASVPPSLQPSSRPSSPSLAADPSGTPKSEKQKTVQEPQTLTAVTPIEPTLEVRGTPETHPTPLRATPEVQQVSSATATSEVHEALSPLMARYSKMPLFIPDSPPEDVGVVPSSTGEVTPNRSPEPEIRVTDSSEEVIVKLDQQFSNLSTEQELSGADAGSKMEDAEAEISEVEGIGRNPYTADGLWYPNRKLKVYVEIPVYASSRAKKQKQKALDNLERIVDQLPAEDLAGYEHRARILRCRWDRCPVRLDCAYKLRYHTEQKHLCSKTEHKCVWRGCQNAEFNNWDELYEHVTEQHLDRLNYCPYEDCEKRCDTIDLLQRHIWRFHVDEDDSTIVSQRRRIAQPTRIVPPDLKPLNELKSVPSYLVDWMYFKVRPAKISKYRRKTLEPWVRQRISEVGASRHSMTPMSPSKRLVSSGYHARESGHDSSNVTDVFGFLRAEVDEDDGGRRRYPALPRRRTLKVSGNSQQENPPASASQGGVTLASGGILPSLTSQGHQGEGGSRSIAETDKMNLGPVYGASYHADHLSSREKFATGGEGTSGEVD